MSQAETIDVPDRILPLSVFVLLSGTAVYFAGSAAGPALADAWGLSDAGTAALTWSVQIGFIVGAVATAVTGLADRFEPQRLIAGLLLLAAGINAALVAIPAHLPTAVGLRFGAGLIAGPVYPIGMKLLATWYPRLGWELGVLLGAYTLGAGASAVLQATGLPWRSAILGASALAILGAVLAWTRLEAGPLLPARRDLSPSAAVDAFRVRPFRLAALTYFGHMWELFALWGLLPLWLASAGLGETTILALTAGVYVSGAAGCTLAGAWSLRMGEAVSARLALGVSGGLALVSPWLFEAPTILIVPAVLVWGAAVVADSPMLSALSARVAPEEGVGTALTAQNAIGFALTIPPLLVLPVLAGAWGSWQWTMLLLAPGPLLALLPLQQLIRTPGESPRAESA